MKRTSKIKSWLFPFLTIGLLAVSAAFYWLDFHTNPTVKPEGDIHANEVAIVSSLSELRYVPNESNSQSDTEIVEQSLQRDKKNEPSLKYIDIRRFLAEKEQPYVTYIAVDGQKVYACLSGRHFIFSEDEGNSWRLDEAIETDGVSGKERSIYLVAITGKGTLIVVGEFLKADKKYIAIWRKPREGTLFSRLLIGEKKGGPPASISVGKLGIVFSQYGSLNLFKSQDDGLTWSKISFAPNTAFKHHVHCVWVHPSENYVYVSGGDAGPKYGEKASASWDGLGGVIRSSDFQIWKKVYTEQPGERIVPITGNQRRRFFGIELANSGALATYDDQNYEVIFGRRSLGFLNFDTLQYTPEGLLLAGTYQYKPTTREGFGQAGELWISDDEGSSFQRIRTTFSIVSAIAYSNKYIFVGFGYGGGGGQIDAGSHILRIPKYGFLNTLKRENKVTKIVFNKTDQTLFRELTPGSYTHYVNMTPYNRIGIYAKVESSCQLEVQGHAYMHDAFYTRDPDRWVTVETLTFDGPGEQTRLLEKGASLFSIFRVKNSSSRSARINQIAFLGSIQ